MKQELGARIQELGGRRASRPRARARQIREMFDAIGVRIQCPRAESERHRFVFHRSHESHKSHP